MIRWLVVALATLASPLAAQQDSLMAQAIRLATEGQSDSAQALVSAQLRRVSPRDSAYPHLLYTAGRVADDRERAMAYFRQVTIEYSNSPWAERALLNLAQLAYAAGDVEGTIRTVDRILLEYPLSTARAEASFLGARAHLDLRNLDRGCRLLNRARSQAGDNVEIANRAAFYIQRCAGVLAAGTETDSAASPEPAAAANDYSVQVAAVSSVAAANELMSALAREGYEAFVVRGDDGLMKIRVGKFRQRSQAEALLAELRGKVGGRPFVVRGS